MLNKFIVRIPGILLIALVIIGISSWEESKLIDVFYGISFGVGFLILITGKFTSSTKS